MFSSTEIGNIAPFDCKGNPTSVGPRWKRWKRSFEFFLVAKDVQKDLQQKALLLHCAGLEVQDIYETLTDPGPVGEDDKEYDKTMRTLDSHFSPQVNVPFERHQFRQANQEESETVDQFVTRLFQLAENCDFSDKKSEHIRDQLIDKCRSHNLRKKLLEAGGGLTLRRAQELARAMEAAERQAKSIESDQTPADQVHNIGRQVNVKQGSCYSCGLRGHYRNDPECKARSATCNNCKRTGHFAKCCRSKPNDNKDSQQQKRHVHSVNEEEEVDYAFAVSTTDKMMPKISINLGGIQLKDVLVDSGSTCNIVCRDTWEKLKQERIMCCSRKTNKHLFAYGAEKSLSVVGEFDAELCYQGKCCTATFVVVEEKACPTLGRQICEELGVIKIMINNVHEQSMLDEFAECCSGVGKLKGYSAKLHVDETVKPVAQKQRPIPFGLRGKVEAKLDELVSADIIEPVEGPTPWVSPVVVVPKPGGDIRLCVDMRKANEAIIRERHPIPTVDEVLYNVNGSKVFSKLDLKWGFHQIELQEESRNITTFITHKGLFRYKRLMFGISSAPELYQHIIQQVLVGCEGAYNIHDDIIVFGSTVEEHDQRLRETLICIKEKGLTLNKDKCVLRMPELTFMGYLLSQKGIGPTESRMEAVVNAREPKNAGEVRSFLGLVNFSARFVPNLATTAEPLRRLTKKMTPFHWNSEQQRAFDTLKSDLANSETLAYFDRNAEETKLTADASPVGLGAVLTQVKNGVEQVVAYASRSLTEVEQRYSQTEKEALGIVWACERFHMYLYGVEFTLLTDHKPLETIYTTKSPIPARIERWVLRLQSYNFTVKYIPGDNNIADSLSRLTNIKGLCVNSDAEEFIRHVAEMAAPNAMTIQEIEGESACDPEMVRLRQCISTGEWDNIPSQYKAVRNELSTLGKLVLRGTRLVIPTKLRSRATKLAHEGHQGVVKTKQRLRTKLWWPGMDKEVEDKCKVCHGCQLVAQPTPPEPLKSTAFPSQPWQYLAVDLMGPLPSGEYVIVVVDFFSRYFEVDIMRSTTAVKVIESLDKIFCTHGLPVTLRTDNGPQFISEQFQSYLAENGIRHSTSTPLWPQANGEVERQNRSILKILKIAHAEKKDMQVELRKFLMAYRTTPHSSTGSTPSKLLFNREMKSKLPQLVDLSTQTYAEAKDKDSESKQKRADYADTRRGARENDITPGDTVLLKQRKANKLSTTFEDGQYEVTAKSGSEVVVTSPEGVDYRRNVTEVKKYLKDDDHLETDTPVVNEPVTSTRPTRETKVPEHLKDYVLYK